MKESLLQRDIRLAIGSRPDTRLFRNNVAQGVVGDVQWIRQSAMVQLRPGDAVVRNARVLHAGLCEGSSDLVGLQRRIITPEMVGRTIGRFVGLEIKTERGRTSEEQERFRSMLVSFGAIAGVVRSIDEAMAVLESA